MTRPLSRPTTPQTGGRSLVKVPWPRRWFARRRGGSSGSRCGSPFFPRVLVRLIGLDDAILQRAEAAVLEGQALELVAELQQLEPVALQLAGQPGRRRAMGEAAEDQQQLDGPPLRAPQRRAGEGIEDAPAVAAAVLEDRGPVPPVDVEGVMAMTARAGQAIRMQPGDQLVVAGLLVHQLRDREVHEGSSHVAAGVDLPVIEHPGSSDAVQAPVTEFPS
jgi:hypothetical protein